MEYTGKVFTPEKSIHVVPVGWHLARPEIVTIDGDEFVGFDSATRYSLPTEFFNHQLKELDPEDTDALLRFMVEYGIPRHPWRGTGYRPSKHAPWLPPNHPEFKVERALDLSDSQAQYGSRTITLEENGEEFDWEVADELLRVGLTSLDEVRFTISLIKTEVSLIFSYMRGEIEEDSPLMGSMIYDRFPSVINDGLSMATHWKLSIDGVPDIHRDMMTFAICEQILEFISSDLQYRECECETIFKRFQPRSGYGSRKAPSRSRFCCEKCRDRYWKRESRKNKRKNANAGDAGTTS